MRFSNPNSGSSTIGGVMASPPDGGSACHPRGVFRPGLIILVILLSVITAGILKPDFYLTGWDNFSSYLNPSNNIFNTIFSTWREHRGLGVPSDAEVNDIFRQIFSVIVSSITGKKLVDQVYFIFMLWGGVLGMYALGRYISQRIKQDKNKQELFGFLTAFFYLFNLSTLAVFYFPMIMYVTRFFMLPTSILVLLKLIDVSSDFTPRGSLRLLVYLAVLFIGFGSFMVPTIFIVMMIVLGLMVLIFHQKKRLIAVMIFYIALNLYWILPFANYTIQKGGIVPYAPTFIEINEAMLNKPKSYFSFERQSKLRPSFFESEFTNNASGLSQSFHELASYDEKGVTRWVLWIFPAAYLAGIILAFRSKNSILIWIATTTVTFLFLSMKEYSILGSVYGFFSDNIPFANTVFRFGDTKFHAVVGFSGSIMAAYFLVWFMGKIIHARVLTRLTFLILGAVFISHLVIYRTYFNGNFVGFFAYNKIPSAYFEMAEIINKDPEAIRAIQLPIDSHSYWKPYAWGYFGSAFLHFMLNKPIFDRTFEPASMENADIHKKILDIARMSASAPADNLLDTRSDDLYQLLRSLSIKYIIDDQTVSVYNEARNITYWGTVKPADSARILAYLEKRGNLKLVKHFEIDADDYISDYARLYPYNNKLPTYDHKPKSINLYQIVNPEPRIQFLTQVNKLDSSQTFLTPASRKSLGHYIQRAVYDSDSLMYPFEPDAGRTKIENGQIKISLPFRLNSGTYIFESKNDANTPRTFLMNVYAQKLHTVIRVYFQDVVFPGIEGESDIHPKSYQTVDLKIERDDFRFLKVGDSIFPIPNTDSSTTQFIGSALFRSNSVPVSLLYPQDTYNVSDHLVQREVNPQCLNDALENQSLQISGDNGVLRISGQNVSGCLTTEISTSQIVNQDNRISYTELEFETEGKIGSLDQKKNIDTGKHALTGYVNALNNPFILDVCLKPFDSSLCANDTSLYRIREGKKKYVVPIAGDMAYINKFLITFTVRSSQRQKYETEITNILLKTYQSGKSENFTVTQPNEYGYEYNFEHINNLNLTAPVAKSAYSQVLNLATDGILIRPDPDCERAAKYKVTKEGNEGILNDTVSCRNNLSRNISFSSNNFYLWYVSYKHLSGAMPALILMDKFNTYMHEKLNPPGISPNSYFSIPPWQKPESILESLILDRRSISELISNTPAYEVSGYVYPRFDLQDNGKKEFIIEHYSQNEGVAELKNMSLIELPNYWVNSRIRPINYQTATFDSQVQVLSSKRLLPSLWQVKTYEEKDGEYLALFNEQYDNQWVILNVPTLFHTRCDGYVNCYDVKLSKGLSTFYLFYTPELLSFIGFTATILSAIAGLFYIKRNDREDVN